jgi:hypothetical protein
MCGRYGSRADKQRTAEWMQTHAACRLAATVPSGRDEIAESRTRRENVRNNNPALVEPVIEKCIEQD